MLTLHFLTVLSFNIDSVNYMVSKLCFIFPFAFEARGEQNVCNVYIQDLL